MNGEEPSGTDVRDFKEVLSTPIDGELPLVVGGHAVHLWALAYKERLGNRLQQWFPLNSKDLDLYGTQELLDALRNEFGGEYRLSGPRSPVIGQLAVQLGGVERKIDVLRNIVGLGPKELSAEPMELEFEADGIWFRCRVLPLITLFQAKVANLSRLDQTDRNDEKHVDILLSVLREYLAELIEVVASGDLGPRGAIAPLEQTLKIMKGSDARQCTAKFATNFSTVWPKQLLLETTDERIRNFVKHRLPASE